MNKHVFMRVIATIMVFAIVVSGASVTALAANFDESVSNNYFTVISEEEYVLCDGATETQLVLNNVDGNDRKVVHYFEVDTKNDNVEVLPGYYGIDKLDPDNLALEGIEDKSKFWKAEQLTKTVAYYEAMGYNVVGGMNTALAYDSNAPYGYMVMNGVVLGTPDVHKGAQTYLAIDAEGNCELRSMSTPLNGTEVTAISANFGWLVKDGVLQSKTVERTSSDASRSMIGIKADGTLVFCQVDGRNAPLSTGLSNYEMGEMMLSLGCVNAVNCDGGGSSTFVSKREGETSNTMRSIPSDGSERPTINSVIIVSKAKATGVFDHAVLDSEMNYYAPGATAVVTATGVDPSGAPTEMPEEGITWALKDSSFGTVENGVFKSNGKKGVVTVQMLYNGEVVGERALNIVDPAVFALALDETVLPYGKEMTIEFNCTYGADNWTVGVDDAYTLTLSDNKAATLDGNKIIATKDESIKGVEVTATYNADTSIKDTLIIEYGKGSEIIFDFEDGTNAGFVGYDEAKQFSIDNGINNSLVGSDPLAGQFSGNVDGDTFVSTDIVRNGKYALAWNVDNTDSDFAGWTYNVLFNIGETIVLRDVANGMNATTLGMWLYIPEGATGLAFQSQLYAKNADGTYTCKQDHFMFETVSGVRKNLNSCTEADIPESRWVYASIDISKYDYICTPVATDTSNSRSPSFIRTYVKPMAPAVHTFYIDDITLDYSSAVDDRVLPTIDNVSYTTADESVVLTNGITINGNNVAFSSTIADNMKLDYTTGKIYVDGNELTNVICSGKVLASETIVLKSGVHTVTFEIKDALGNIAKAIRTFTIAGIADVTLSGHNDSGEKPEYGSIYYVDVNVDDIKAVNKLTASLKLQDANTWEPQGTVVADGFKVTYSVDKVENILNITIERNGYAIDETAKTLVSVPVRLWTWDAIDHVTGKPITPETQYATGYCPVVTVDCEVVCGLVNDKDYFGGKISVETMINDTVHPWHYHDSELTVSNQDVTCTVDGFENRTYCETCKSVVDWGTIIPATGHNYEVVDGRLACGCGENITSSGIIVIGDNTYYAVSGKLAIGWVVDGNDYYYMDKTTFSALKNGRYTIDGFDYSFDKNGVHTEGQWVHLFYNGEYATRYTFAGKYVVEHFHEINGKNYYFGEYGILAKGTQILQLADGVDNKYIYVIDENGVVDGVLNYTGVYNLNGILYNVVNGKLTGGGVQDINGSRYYVEWNGVVPTGKIYIVQERTNGLVEPGWYYINEYGMLNNEFFAIEGKVHYIVNGQPAKGLGVINVDGNLYYINGMGVVGTGKVYVSANETNGLVNAGYIYTDETGRIYNNEFVEIEGKVLYVVNGQPVKSSTSLVKEIDGNLYFVEWNGNVATGKIYISANETNGLTTSGWHYTDETGRFYDKEVVTLDDGNFYMNKGMKDATGVSGVRNINGGLYFVEWNGNIPVGKQYIAAEYVNGLTTAGWHYTDETGRLYDNEFATIDGKIYYMVHGQMDRTGVSKVREINGGLYFVEWNGNIPVGKQYIGAEYVNGLTTAGWHYTDETGRLYDNEFATIDGKIYYMVHGQMDRTGVSKVREINGGLYFVEWNGHIPVGKQYISAEYVNGLTTAGWHYTDETGRLYDNEFATIDGKIYYMVHGQMDRTGVSKVREINGGLYFVEWNGNVATGKIYTEKGWKYTDETGAFYDNEFATIDGELRFLIDGSFYTGGVFEYDGNLYYATWNGIIATNGKLYIMKDETNDLIVYGYHTFDASGKMIG